MKIATHIFFLTILVLLGYGIYRTLFRDYANRVCDVWRRFIPFLSVSPVNKIFIWAYKVLVIFSFLLILMAYILILISRNSYMNTL